MDWIAAMDDLMTQRLCRCTACSQPSMGWWGLWQGYGLIVAYVLCERCHVMDRELCGVRAVMEQRYGSRKSTVPSGARAEALTRPEAIGSALLMNQPVRAGHR